MRGVKKWTILIPFVTLRRNERNLTMFTMIYLQQVLLTISENFKIIQNNGYLSNVISGCAGQNVTS